MASLFARWFKRPVPVEDRVWVDADACAKGVCAQVAQALDDGASVLLLARSTTDREDLGRDLAAHAPRIGGDRFAAIDLQSHLRDRGTLGLACVHDLRPLAAASAQPGTRLEIHVLGRDGRRAGDRALMALLTDWAPVRIVFHHALDDALLRAHAASLQPLLGKLGWQAGEPIASPLLARAIERAQRP